MLKRPALLTAFVVCLCAARIIGAQSQLNSVQASATMLIVGSNYTVPGAEVQYRRTFSAWSVGAGIQFFYDPTKVCVTTANCSTAGGTSVFFVEPRYVLAHNDKSAFYVAGRLGYSGTVSDGGLVVGGGGGLMQILNESLSLDLGAQIYTSSGNAATLQLRGGLSFGF